MKAFWSCALMTLVSAGVSAGYSLAGLFGEGGANSSARYAASRSMALLLVVLLALGVRSRIAILFLGVTMSGVQLFDSWIGFLAHDASKTYGPLVFALVNAGLLVWLHRRKDIDERATR